MIKGGLFVIPLQSNVTGSRYSYTLMSLVQENGWHFFCENPLGFCCLFIKKSIGLFVLKGSTTNAGIVSLVPPLKLEAPKGKAPLHEIEEIINSRTNNTLQCKPLDQADSLGLVLISSRTRLVGQCIDESPTSIFRNWNPCCQNLWSKNNVWSRSNSGFQCI
ncbi:molybdenum cofactor sulfurase-like [Gossypium australe]|uniref:Molybdenum cofactor sulfurase-like n=1 Tax=Gossypium australe TaxID=47621 RepID=A0A5B6W8G7_9ROSI|nr:molybdenum cofactor sulfurase-like [Gossypium australe]